MATKTGKLLAPASPSIFVALFAACSTGSADGVADESSSSGGPGTGGVGASGGTGGALGSGGSITGGTSTGGAFGSGGSSAGGSGGSACPAPDYVIWPPADGSSGGAASGTSFLCDPGVTCVSPDLPIPGGFPMTYAFVHLGSDPEGRPDAKSPSREPNVVLTSPEPGRFCVKGDDGAVLSFALGDPAFWDGVGAPRLENRIAPTPWGAIKFIRFETEIATAPESGVSVGFGLFSPTCGEFIGEAKAQYDERPVVMNSGDGALILALDSEVVLEYGAYRLLRTAVVGFGADFNLGLARALEFYVGEGPYEYCISNIEFMGADGR